MLHAIDECPELNFIFPDKTDASLRPVAQEFAHKLEQQSFADAVGSIDGLLMGIQCPAKSTVPDTDGGQGAAHTDMAAVRDQLIQLMTDLLMLCPLVRQFDNP